MIKEYLNKLQQEVLKLRAKGKYKETIEKCYELLNKGRENNDYKTILTAYLNLAASYYCIGDIKSAFESLIKHEEICEKYGDELDKLNSYNVLFLLHEYNKDIDKAKETLEKSIALGSKLEKYNIVSNSYSNYSHICMKEKDYRKALEKAIIGLQIAKKHEPRSKILEIRVKLNMAKAYIELSAFKAANILIEDISQKLKGENFAREKSQVLDLKGHWYIKQNLYKEAFDEFTEAKGIVESYGDIYLLKDIQEQRCKICDEINDIKLGYYVQKEYIQLLQQINEKELEVTALKHEIRRVTKGIEKRANTDYLTGLYNRSYLENIADNILRQAYEKKESVICAVFDIDNFKNINDTYGHLVGDEIIKVVSKTCIDNLEESNIIARYGGDEFVIFMKETSFDNSVVIMRKLLKAIRNLKIYRDDKQLSITISMGISVNNISNNMNFLDMFNIADKNLYIAKTKGKNQMYY